MATDPAAPVTGPGVHDSRTPHKVFLLIACVLAGVSGVITHHARGPSIADSFPGYVQIVWYAGLTIGSGLCLAGIIHRGLTGAMIEQAGMFMLTGLMTSFAAAAVAHSGTQAIPTALIITGFGVANAVRAHQIHQDIALIRRNIAHLGEEGPRV
jgi:hypothetical protein